MGTGQKVFQGLPHTAGKLWGATGVLAAFGKDFELVIEALRYPDRQALLSTLQNRS
jgi:hypothetical protein